MIVLLRHDRKYIDASGDKEIRLNGNSIVVVDSKKYIGAIEYYETAEDAEYAFMHPIFTDGTVMFATPDSMMLPSKRKNSVNLEGKTVDELRHILKRMIGEEEIPE